MSNAMRPRSAGYVHSSQSAYPGSLRMRSDGGSFGDHGGLGGGPRMHELRGREAGGEDTDPDRACQRQDGEDRAET